MLEVNAASDSQSRTPYGSQNVLETISSFADCKGHSSPVVEEPLEAEQIQL
jgi:hypothetical protein